MCSIGVVIVTYNRLEKLKVALQSYEAQIYKPKFILVVDNHSTDGTKEFLEKWNIEFNGILHKILSLKENIGGSGGFYEGLKYAKSKQVDWVWVADDDAYPQKDCFKILVSHARRFCDNKISALCSSVYTNGRIDTWHRRRFSRQYGVVRIEERINTAEYERNFFELDLFSYVGTLIKRDAIMNAGLPQKDFFISYDDSEHSIRIRKQGKILCIPNAKVIHDTLDTDESVITWKKYYALRNKVYSYNLHFGRLQSFIQILYYNLKNSKDKVLSDMTKEALYDARRGNLGMNAVYKPGWKGNMI